MSGRSYGCGIGLKVAGLIVVFNSDGSYRTSGKHLGDKREPKSLILLLSRQFYIYIVVARIYSFFAPNRYNTTLGPDFTFSISQS